jgi:hypothetical protein
MAGFAVAVLRRWALHGSRSLGVVLSVSLSSPSALARVGGFRCLLVCGGVGELQRCFHLLADFMFRVAVVLMPQSNQSACDTRVDVPIQPGKDSEFR